MDKVELPKGGGAGRSEEGGHAEEEEEEGEQEGRGEEAKPLIKTRFTPLPEGIPRLFDHFWNYE